MGKACVCQLSHSCAAGIFLLMLDPAQDPASILMHPCLPSSSIRTPCYCYMGIMQTLHVPVRWAVTALGVELLRKLLTFGAETAPWSHLICINHTAMRGFPFLYQVCSK